MRRDAFIKSIAALAAAGGWPLAARAAPSVKIMIPANPGGGWDTTGRALGRALGRPSFFWTPGFMLRLMLGEAANIVTAGQRVLPKKALALGYKFKYPGIDAALAEIFKR